MGARHSQRNAAQAASLRMKYSESSFIICQNDDPFSVIAQKIWREAIQSEVWSDSMISEIKSLQEQNTWEIVSKDLVQSHRILPCKRVFKFKVDAHGKLTKERAVL